LTANVCSVYSEANICSIAFLSLPTRSVSERWSDHPSETEEEVDMAIRTNTLSRAAVLLIAVVVFFLLILASAVGAQNEVIPTAQHRIVAGETLWSIADGVTPEGADVRVTVSQIRRLNQLGGTAIYPGDVLIVPVAG